MIDLHTHTTASDGRCTPAALVQRAAAAGVTVLSVTDHDTVAACDAVRAACGAAGLEFADEERAHRDLLIHEYNKLRERLASSRDRQPAARVAKSGR